MRIRELNGESLNVLMALLLIGGLVATQACHRQRPSPGLSAVPRSDSVRPVLYGRACNPALAGLEAQLDAFASRGADSLRTLVRAQRKRLSQLLRGCEDQVQLLKYQKSPRPEWHWLIDALVYDVTMLATTDTIALPAIVLAHQQRIKAFREQATYP